MFHRTLVILARRRQQRLLGLRLDIIGFRDLAAQRADFTTQLEQFAGVAIQSFVLVTQRDELATDLAAFTGQLFDSLGQRHLLPHERLNLGPQV